MARRPSARWAGMAGLAVAVIVSLAACSSSSPSGNASTSTTSTQNTNASTNNTNVGPSGTAPATNLAWARQVSSLAHRLQADVPSGNLNTVAGIAQACTKLANDFSAIRAVGVPPNPPAGFNALWTQGLQAAQQGASTCATGAQSSNVQQIEQGAAQIQQGGQQIQQAVALVQ